MHNNNPMMFVRSLKGAPSSVLWVLVLVRQALTARELCAYTGYKLDSVREAMQVLSGYSLVVEQRRAHGEAAWSLGEGVQFLLPGVDPRALSIAGIELPEPEFCADEDGQNRIKSDSDDAMVIDADVQNRIKSDSGTDEDAQSWKKSDSGSLESRLDRETLESIKNLEDSIYLDSAEISKKTSPELLCKHAHLVLGRSVRCDDVVRARPVGEILAWIAHAYQAGDALSSPYGFVYRGLRRELKAGERGDPNKRPDPQFAENPFAFLPYAYLEAVGLGEYHVSRCKGCGLLGGEHAEWCLQNHQVEYVSERWQSVSMPDDDFLVGDWPETTESQAAAVAWAVIKPVLQESMPSAAYDTWVADVRYVGLRDGTVFLSARNSFARDWLNGRMGERTAGLFEQNGVICQVAFVDGHGKDDSDEAEED